MKKRLFTILTVLVGVMFVTSCDKKDDPVPPFNPTVKATNEEILDLMKRNYLWTLPASPNSEQETPAFFASLLNQNDHYTDVNANGQMVAYNYSRISPVTTPVPTYDPGFEYAINKYVSGVTYYVVLYIKPGTNAALDQSLGRGMYITTVNGTTVTETNASTLLYNAYKDGNEVNLKIRTPMVTTELPVKFTPAKNYVEAPMIAFNTFMAGTKKVGYICYNSFVAGTNGEYDTSLASKLNEFKNEGVKVLVFDVRYNSSGNTNSVVIAGSAMVKDRDVSKTFIQQVFRPDLPNPSVPLNFLDNTKPSGGTAIPKLGDNLEKIYIITGQTTAGAPEALINALKAYRSADIILVGEKTKGRTVAVARSTENGPQQPGNWNLTLAFNYLADMNKNYSNYASGFTPNTEIKEVEVAAKAGILLGDLGVVDGAKKEVVLSKVRDMIAGITTRSTSVSTGSDRPLETSLGNRPGSNETTVDLQQ